MAYLFHDRKSLLYRSQFINLLCTSLDFFLYDDRGLRLERVNLYLNTFQFASLEKNNKLLTTQHFIFCMPLIKKNSFCSTEISFFVQFYLTRNINTY